MWKAALFASSLSLMLLAGCNDDNNANEAERGVEDAVDDTSDAIRDTVDPDRTSPNGTNDTNVPGTNNNGTVDTNPNTPNGSAGPGVENGVTAPGAPSENQEGIIEDKADMEDKDNLDNK